VSQGRGKGSHDKEHHHEEPVSVKDREDREKDSYLIQSLAMLETGQYKKETPGH
jgi:hypothetical protein